MAHILFPVTKLLPEQKIPYSDWSDAQVQFKQHMIAINGIYSESAKMVSKMEPPMFKLFKQVNKPRRTTKFYDQLLTMGLVIFLNF